MLTDIRVNQFKSVVEYHTKRGQISTIAQIASTFINLSDHGRLVDEIEQLLAVPEECYKRLEKFAPVSS